MSQGSHIFHKFDEELEGLRSRVLAMAGLVEEQVADALKAFVESDSQLAEQVSERDHEVNGMEVLLDEECARILAIRQPAARDLRLIFAIIKTITDLERIGDQADRIAKVATDLSHLNTPRDQVLSIRHLGEQVRDMFREALDAFARMDVDAALRVIEFDVVNDREYRSILRQLITYMMEDPRAIRGALDVVWAARALERIGDHTKNICEYLVYMVRGKDVRHTSRNEEAPAASSDDNA